MSIPSKASFGSRSQTFPYGSPRSPPAGGRTTTWGVAPLVATSPTDPSQPLPRRSIQHANTFAYTRSDSAIYDVAFMPVADTAPDTARKAREKLEKAEDSRPDKSKRFLSTKLYYAGCEVVDGNTIFTFSSSNSTLATCFNGITLGLSSPLCRVYFVEILFEGMQIPETEEWIRYTVENELGFTKWGESTTGDELVRWLEYQEHNEMKKFGFEKLQGNSFAVYLVTLPKRQGEDIDNMPLRRRVEDKYKILDGFDNVIMLGGRFHNSIYSLFH